MELRENSFIAALLLREKLSSDQVLPIGSTACSPFGERCCLLSSSAYQISGALVSAPKAFGG